jgi:peptidoglycan-associated lipoprotein
MSLKKLLAVGAAILSLAGCSTLGDYEGVAANQSQIDELTNKVGDRVFFEFDSSSLTNEAKDTLKKQAGFMKDNVELRFTLEGHCDDRGTREYNLALGERRAHAAKQYLVSLGVEHGRLTVVSFGKEKPAVVGDSEFAWSQNRRSVTVAQ